MARCPRIAAALVACALILACEAYPTTPVEPPVGLAFVRPATPASLTALPGLNSVALEWSDSPNETHYELGRAPAPGTTVPVAGAYTLVASPAANTTSYTDNSVSPKTRYRYRLRACNADGCSGYRYVYVTTLTPPPPPVPGDFAAAMVTFQVNLTWSDVDGETSYKLQRALAPEGGPIGTTVNLRAQPANTTSFVDADALYNKRYRYRIRACNAGGCSAHATIYVTTPPPPPPATVPTNFTGTPDEDGDVVLGWTDSNNETRYEIQRALSPSGTTISGGTPVIATPGADATTYTDESSVQGKRYRYRIRACNPVRCSAFATIYVAVPLPPPPDVPGDFAGDPATGDVVLTWTDVGNETSYKLQRAPAPEGGPVGTTVNLPTQPAGATTYTDAAALAGMRYRYRIQACNLGGCSGYATIYVTTPPPPPPATLPTNFAGIPEEDGDVVLTWNDASNETEYRIERALAPLGGTISGNAVIATPGADATTYTDESSVIGKRYRYRIRACNAGGCSAYATIYVVVPAPSAPPVPTNFVGTADDNSVDLSWDDTPNEDSYQIERAFAPLDGAISGNATLATLDANVEAYVDETVSPSTRYRYRIRACNELGCSNFRTIYVVTSADADPFDIQLVFMNTPTPTELAAFSAAEQRWEDVITADIPNVDSNHADPDCPIVAPVDDVRIFVYLAPDDGPGGVLGFAGPCWVRVPSGLPITGLMSFDTDDLEFMAEEGLLEGVILHEMGHVLGIGTLWYYEGLLEGEEGADPFFDGPHGITGFNNVGGIGYLGNKVPVENQGGPGTALSHWRESILDTELMTGYAEFGAMPMSEVTIRSLVDHGYTVDVGEADSYTLPGAPSLRIQRPKIKLEGDILRRPIWAVDEHGRVRQVR